jgi:hypothetical protein
LKTLVIIEIDHNKPLPDLADLVAQRAWTLSGVNNVELINQQTIGDPLFAGLIAKHVSPEGA